MAITTVEEIMPDLVEVLTADGPAPAKSLRRSADTVASLARHPPRRCEFGLARLLRLRLSCWSQI
jgi:hypothetical protein